MLECGNKLKFTTRSEVITHNKNNIYIYNQKIKLETYKFNSVSCVGTNEKILR